MTATYAHLSLSKQVDEHFTKRLLTQEWTGAILGCFEPKIMVVDSQSDITADRSTGVQPLVFHSSTPHFHTERAILKGLPKVCSECMSGRESQGERILDEWNFEKKWETIHLG